MQRFFQDSCIFAQATFFTVSTSSEHLFHQSNRLVHQLLFLEQLYLQTNYFFGAASFLEQLPFLSISFQIRCFFKAQFFREATFSEGLLFRRTSYFFMACTSTQHQILQNSYFFNKATFTIKVPFSVVNFSEKLILGSS